MERPPKIARLGTTEYAVGQRALGPKALAAWPDELEALVDKMAARGVDGHLVSECLATKSKIWVTSSYTGMGTFEHVLERIALAMGGKKPAGTTDQCPPFHFWSANEVDAKTRELLLRSKHCPTHVFGDLRGQVDEMILRHMDFVIATLQARLEKMSQGLGAEQRKAIEEELNTKCMKKLIYIASTAVKQGAVFQEGWCYVHNCHCPLFPKKAPTDLRLEVAGNTCVAFSPQGKRAKWLHKSAVPAAIWLARTAECTTSSCASWKADMVLQECSHAFNTEDAFAEAFPGGHWKTRVLQVSPVDVGCPLTRPRNFSWSWDLFRFQLAEEPSVESFLALCGANPACDGHDFFLGSEDVLRKFREKVRQSQDLCSNVEGAGIDQGESYLATGARARLLAYREALKASGQTEPPILDLSQNPSVRSKFSSRLPSVLCGSMVWSERFAREMLPQELFLSMGWPVPSLLGDSDASFPFDEDFIFSEVSKSVRAKWIGNSIHCRVVGLLATYFMCITQTKFVVKVEQFSK